MNQTNLTGSATHTDPASADTFSIHGPRPAVTRVSRRAVMLAAIFGAAMGLVVLVAGFNDQSRPKRDGNAQESSIRPTGPIDSIRDLPSDYSFDVQKAAQGIGYAAPATRPSGPPLPTAQELALAEQLRQLADLRGRLLEQERKEQEQAMDSTLVFAGAKPAAAAMLASSEPSSTTKPTMLVLNRPDTSGNGVATPSGFEGTRGQAENDQQDKQAFLTQAASVEPYLNKPLLNPISKYELKAGTVIPGALVTAINTDLPGEIIAQVTENVYDSVTGKYLLIPQGSRLLGTYQSLVTNGQNRALLVWQRLIYPDGDSIVLDGMPGTDQTGQAGLSDKVDYHFDKLAEATALTTALAYAGNLARNPQSTSGNGNQDVVGDSVAQQANRIGEKIIDRQLDLQPTITIRSGWPLRVLVNKDMLLAPYKVTVN
jgi:type IV secretory pathway VirB10-like protein